VRPGRSAPAATRWPFCGQVLGLYGAALPVAFLGAVSVPLPFLEAVTPLGIGALYAALVLETFVPAVVTYYRFRPATGRPSVDRIVRVIARGLALDTDAIGFASPEPKHSPRYRARIAGNGYNPAAGWLWYVTAQSDRERIAASSIVTSRVRTPPRGATAVYIDGESVIDLAGGVEAPDGRKTRETRHVLFSVRNPTRPLRCTRSSGGLAYDDRVVDHWPEFAAEGSGEGRHNGATGAQPTSGLNRGEIDDRPDLWGDWDAVVEQLEAMEPNFPPGRRRPITP